MKKIILSFAVAIIISAAFVSCKKESASTKASVQIPIQPAPVAAFIQNKNAMPGTDGSFYELGVKFQSAANGNIKSFKLHLPQAGNYLVTLWKVSDKSIVTNSTISCTHIDSWQDSIAVDIPIQAGTDYILSTNANIFYYFNYTGGTFPFKIGDITISDFSGAIGSTQQFPSLPLTNTPSGFVDFSFQRSE